jgi:hypothetical protein
MIFRAVFWIGLVSLLMPHEPDLGLGRPGAGTSSSAPASIRSAANGLSRTDQDCSPGCAGGLLSVFHLNSSGLIAGLADVKAQIAQDRRDRAQRAKTI